MECALRFGLCSSQFDANRISIFDGSAPIENEYERLIHRHKSPEHTVLIIQAAEALVEFGGYRIAEQAPDIQLLHGGPVIPDLVAVDQRDDFVVASLPLPPTD
jgi:hypothetical protein